MNDFVLYEVPITLCALALPFTGFPIIAKWFAMHLLGALTVVIAIAYEIARFIVLSLCTIFLFVIFSPWILYGLFQMANDSFSTSEYRAIVKSYRKAEKYFRKSFHDFMVQRDKNTWPHVEIDISNGSATVIVHDRSQSGIRLEPTKYVYRFEGNKIITESGEIMDRKYFEEEIDNLLSPHTIEPPVSIKS